MPKLVQPFNPNERHEQPLLYDNNVPIADVPAYELGMGGWSQASQYRDYVRRFSSSPRLQTNEQAVRDYFAMILASTMLPVYKMTLNGRTNRVVLTQQFNALYAQLREDPTVEVMAHDFATNPEYRQNMLQQNGTYNRTHFLSSLVTGYRTYDDPQAENEQQNANPQPENINRQQNINPEQQNQDNNQDNNQQNNRQNVNPENNRQEANLQNNLNQGGEQRIPAGDDDEEEEDFIFRENYQDPPRNDQDGPRVNVMQPHPVVNPPEFNAEPPQVDNRPANQPQRQENARVNPRGVDPEDIVFEEGFNDALPNVARRRNRELDIGNGVNNQINPGQPAMDIEGPRPQVPPYINVGQPAMDIEGPRIRPEDVGLRMAPQPQENVRVNPRGVDPEDIVFQEGFNDALPNVARRRNRELNIGNGVNNQINPGQPAMDIEGPRPQVPPYINVGQPAMDIEGPRIRPEDVGLRVAPQRQPRPQLDPEEEFVFQENVGDPNNAENQPGNQRRGRRLNIVGEDQQVNNQPLEEHPPRREIRDGWVIADEQNEREGNLDDLLNEPVQNPQNQEDQEEDDDVEIGNPNFRVRYDENGRPVVEDQPAQNAPNELMGAYDPTQIHYPSRVLDRNVPNVLPVFNRQRPGVAADLFGQVRNFPNNPQNVFANEALVRNHIAGTLALSEMVLFRAQTEQGDVPVIDQDEFDQRYNRFLNDPAVATMAQQFVQNPLYRQNLLGGPNPDADAFIRNTVDGYRNLQMERQQENANRPLPNRENPLRQNRLNNPNFWNAPNVQQNNREPQNVRNQPQQNPQVQEIDINQLNGEFVNPNEDLEGNVAEDIRGEAIPEAQQNQNLQNQNRQNQNQQNENRNQRQNQQILPDANGQITYRQYIDMLAASLQDDPDAAIRENTVANMLAAQMLIGGGENKPVNWQQIAHFSENFQRQESFREMLQNRQQDVRRAMMNKDPVALIGILAETENARNDRLSVYQRPKDRVQDDSALLQNALDSVKKKSGRSKSPAKEEKKNPLYKRMTDKWTHFRNVTAGDIQPTGAQVRELIDITKRYINKGTALAGGPDGKFPPAFKEAMCVLKRYMPEKEFETYCNQINAQQNTLTVEPSAFIPGRMTGYAVTGEELLNNAKEALKKEQTPELYATVAAIQNLTKGRIGLIVNSEELEREKRRILQPGSALRRVLEDPQSKANLDALAKNGRVKTLAAMTEHTSREHIYRTVAGQFNLSARLLTGGPLNRYYASKTLSMLLATARTSDSSDPGLGINNRAFREKAEEIERDPNFRKLLDRYMSDERFRRSVNEELTRPRPKNVDLEQQMQHLRTACASLEQEMQQLGGNQRLNREPVRNLPGQQPNRQQNPQQNRVAEEDYDPRDMRPREKRALDNGVGVNGLQTFRGQYYTLSDPMARTIRDFAANPQANEQEALRIFKGVLALSRIPVYKQDINGQQQKVVDAEQFNRTFQELDNDPAVRRMAHEFATNPQYRERILHGNNERTADGMIANISKELNALKRQELQAQQRRVQNPVGNNQQNLQNPQNPVGNNQQNLQNQQVPLQQNPVINNQQNQVINNQQNLQNQPIVNPQNPQNQQHREGPNAAL